MFVGVTGGISNTHSACGKLIAPIAKRILAQPICSSSFEQNWSSYSFVHNKSRNRLNTKRAADLVYVYTNLKVVSASKENDEKKWYNENVDSEDSDAPMSGEEDSPSHIECDEGTSIEGGNDDRDVNVMDHFCSSPNWRTKDIRPNAREAFEFVSDDDDLRKDVDLPSLARCVDGSGFLNSENILSEKKTNGNIETFVGEAAEVMDGEVQTTEVACKVVEKEGSLGKGSGNEEFEVDVEYADLGKEKVSLSESSGPMQSMLEWVRDRREALQNGKRAEGEDEDDVTYLNKCLRIPLKNTDAEHGTEDGIRRFGVGERLMKASRGLQSSNSVLERTVSSSDNDRKPLASVFRKNVVRPSIGRLVISRNSGLESNEGIKVEIDVVPESIVVKEDVLKKEKKRREMQPFAMSLAKKTNLGGGPLDGLDPISNNKLKKTVSLREENRKSILEAKKEKRKKKPRTEPSILQVIKEGLPMESSSSEDMRDTSDKEDILWRSAGNSSGAEVKGDSDYIPER